MKRLLLYSLFLLCSFQNLIWAKETVKIGFCLPLSGNVAVLGEGMRNGALMALKEEQKKNLKYDYQLLFEDDQFEAKRVALVGQKLIKVNHVNFVISPFAYSAKILKPMIIKNNLIHFSFGWDGSMADGKNNFIHWPKPIIEAKVMFEKFSEQGIKSCAIIGLNDSDMYWALDGIKKEAAKHKIKISCLEIHNLGERDFRGMIAKISKENPDRIIIMSNPPELDLILQQVKDLGLIKKVTSIELPDFTERKDLFEGREYVSVINMSEKFEKAYREQFKTEPHLMTPYVYDVVKMLIAGCEAQSGKSAPSHQEIQTYLRNLKDFEGARGKLSVGEDGIIMSDIAWKRMENGKGKELKVYSAEQLK
jgi:branched-chain amino acid transport system substrate-binding protein